MTDPSDTGTGSRPEPEAGIPAGHSSAAVSAMVDEPRGEEAPQGMIPARDRRRTRLERGSMRVLATGGIIGIATALGAVLVENNVTGWIVGLVVGLTSVILAALLWSSRQL